MNIATIQFVNILQMNCIEFRNYVDRVSQENPVFEIEPVSFRPTEYRALKREAGKDDEEIDIAEPMAKKSMYQDICVQLSVMGLDKATSKVCRLFARHLDERGYLPEEDYEQIARATGTERAEKALKIIQQISPTGIGARNLSECLCLQLEKEGGSPLAHRIATEYLEQMGKGHFQQISKLTGASVAEVRRACETIRSLNPRPGHMYSNDETVRYVIPDLFLNENGDISLNEKFMPKLSYIPVYEEIMADCDDSEAKKYLREKFDQANMLAKNIEQRNETLYKCAKAIQRRQQLFFYSGDMRDLQPLTQAQIAEDTGLSESTVSRAVSEKYIQSRKGTYSLKIFFSGHLAGKMTISSADAKERVRLLIENEDKTDPLSDQRITDILSAEGVNIQRSTVAKYRKQLNIPGTYARKNSST